MKYVAKGPEVPSSGVQEFPSFCVDNQGVLDEASRVLTLLKSRPKPTLLRVRTISRNSQEWDEKSQPQVSNT